MSKTFNCSMCSAPLTYNGSAGPTTVCPYCNNTVILPDELRAGANPSAARNSAGLFAAPINQALKLAEVKRLVQSGNKLAAVKLYRETFGTGLKEAVEAVERLEAGQPLTFTQTSFATENHPAQNFATGASGEWRATAGKRRGGAFRALLILLAIGGLFLALFMLSRRASGPGARGPSVARSGAGPISSQAQGFAAPALEFGSEGIGAGQFKDARSVAVDGQGRIYVGEYTGGRVQVFDSEGKFLTQWMADTKAVLLDLAADRKGTVYVVHPGHIFRYDGATGNLLGEVQRLNNGVNEFYSDAFVALDGNLYAIGSNSNILRIGPDGKIRSTLKVAEKVGEDISLDRVVVSGTGDIYALERKDGVFRFAPDGRYVNRFGGSGDGPGQFISANALAVDGQGRVYVSDSGRGIQVFDGAGRYLDSFGGREVVFGMTVNDRDEIFATLRNRHKVVKYALNKR